MMDWRRCSGLFVLVFLGWVDSASAEWRAGVAKTVITPEELTWMAGYGSRDHVAEGKLTDLWAKALVLEDGEKKRAVIITLDLVGIGRELSVSVCDNLQKRFSLRRDQISLCLSHTHTGPVVSRNLRPMHYAILNDGQKKQIDDYSHFLEEKIIGIVGEALESMDSAGLFWASGEATFAVNRRNNPEAKVPELRAAGELVGPFDHSVPVLVVKDGAGKNRVVLFGYACHATVLGIYQWSGDYPGFAQMAIEEAFPDCIAMFWAGCGADQNPLPRRTVELAKEYGQRLGAAVIKTVKSPLQPVADQIKTTYRDIDLELDTLPTREQLVKQSQSSNKYEVSRAQMLLKQIDAGQPLSQTYPYPVASWQLGEKIQFVFLGGEVVVDYALRLKKELKGKAVWVAGYSNDVMAYIPSLRVLLEGGYEGERAMVYYGLPTKWSTEVEEAIVDEVHRQAAQ